MKEFEKYIVVAALRGISQQSLGRSGFSASELRDSIKSWFGVEFSNEEVRSAFLGALDGQPARDLVDRVSSPFAVERFLLNTGEPRAVAKAAGVLNEWHNWEKIGDEWLQEALTNIRSELDYGNLSSEQFSQTNELEYKSVPASDRYVSTQDNQQTIQDLSSELTSLREQVESSNSIEDEARLIALSEIALFETAICQPRLSLDLIERFLKFCSSRLSVWIGAAFVELVVEKLKAMLDDFIMAMVSAG